MSLVGWEKRREIARHLQGGAAIFADFSSPPKGVSYNF